MGPIRKYCSVLLIDANYVSFNIEILITIRTDCKRNIFKHDNVTNLWTIDTFEGRQTNANKYLWTFVEVQISYNLQMIYKAYIIISR